MIRIPGTPSIQANMYFISAPFLSVGVTHEMDHEKNDSQSQQDMNTGRRYMKRQPRNRPGRQKKEK